VVVPPLAVCAGDTVPQEVLPQLTDQFTPRLLLSFATDAARVAAWPPAIVAGGPCVCVTTIGVVVMMFATAAPLQVGSVTEVALMLTVPPAGTARGPTKVAAPPLAVCALMDPQAPVALLPQLTVQVTPALFASFVTLAISCTLSYAPVVVAYVLAGVTLTPMATTGRMVTVPLTDLVESVTEAAVIVTVPPLGTLDGAV
jgi:hypothetical protein